MKVKQPRTPQLRGLLFGALALCFAPLALAEDYKLLSPDGSIAATLSVGDKLSYQVAVNNVPVVLPSHIALQVQGKQLMQNLSVKNTEGRSVDQKLTPAVKVKSAEIQDKFNELTINFNQPLALIVRAYNNGVAYRFATRLGGKITVEDEQAEFNFAPKSAGYLPVEESFYSHNERTYIHKDLGAYAPQTLSSLPALVSSAGVKVLITETALEDYAGLWLNTTGRDSLTGTLPHYVTKLGMFPADDTTRSPDREKKILERANFIAKTQGTRSFPWRILAIAKTDGDLITNQLPYQLADESKIADTSWIKPGKVAWDWYNANNIFGVDFKSGINTQTYKYYIDFASKYGLEYVILDEGWYPLGNLLATAPDMNIEELVAYGKQKNVKLILWMSWKTLDEQFKPAMERFTKLGIAGIKVDFMQRDDQEMVNFYWKMAAETAKRHLLLSLHGAYKPAGLQRTYPNAITREGVKGLEWNKWSNESTPTHNTTLPFIRMVAGAMDYTPGAMINSHYSTVTNKNTFAQRFESPMSQTTRVQQMAMFSVFESPIQMLADTPSNYMKEAECTQFIAAVPSVWDETRVLAASVGEYIVVARRSGKDWFIGAMNNETPRELAIDLSFLGDSAYQMDAFADGINADRLAADYKHTTSALAARQFKISMAEGGGWTAHLTPAQ